ncbi:hypothetical protein ZIOFF_020227 [Zingiber officinale]|uniref:Legume lectin domain-containing protein n=1 Tax=Zingiber officinale TaxID=94328 RepID=A0A8J5H5A0_ZINOF|nr:hypothetical protein ZIOFF_020227 [Zingiber officinale]
MPPRLRIFAMLLSPPVSFFLLAVFLLLAASLSCGSCDEAGLGFRFSFDGSVKDRSFGAEFDLYGDAEVSGSAVRITRPANASSGRMAYRKPIRFFGTKLGFSSSFSFSISPAAAGFAFFLSPASALLERGNGYLAESSTSLMAVRFATAKTGNLSGSLIEITVSGEVLAKSSNLSVNGSVPYLNRGEKLHSLIDFDGDSKIIQVKLWRDKDSTPMNSPTSYAVDLSSNFLRREAVLVSLTSWSRNSTQGSSIYSWNFTARHGAPYLMHSEPLDPNSFLVRPTQNPPVHPRRAYPWGMFIAMVFAAACGAMLAFFLMFVWAGLGWRWPVSPVEFSVGVDYGTAEGTGEKDLKSEMEDGTAAASAIPVTEVKTPLSIICLIIDVLCVLQLLVINALADPFSERFTFDRETIHRSHFEHSFWMESDGIGDKE